jgi:AP-4 complex subunit mu-1
VIEPKQSLIDLKKLGNLSLFTGHMATGGSSLHSVIKHKSNEIFIDVIEKMNILFNASGYVINSSIDGCIQMKSYLHGNPSLKLMLNEDLVMGGEGYGSVVLDDCNFHESVNYSEFLMNKSLRITPP